MIYNQFVAGMTARPRLALVVLFALAALIVAAAAGVRIDADLGRLLPDDSPSVHGLRQLQNEYRDQVGRLTLVISGAPLEDEHKLARELQRELAMDPGVDRVVIEDPRRALLPWRLLYLSLDDVRTVDARVRARIRAEKRAAHPLFIDVGGSPPTPLDFSDIEARYPTTRGSGYETADGRVLVFVHPNFPASDLDASRDLIKRIGTASRLLAQPYGARIDMTGRYQKRIDQQVLIERDIRNASLLVVLLLLGFLLYHLRSVRNLALVLLPLGVGTATAVATARLTFGDLNILTAFLMTILMGVGVDYGIHFVDRMAQSEAETSVDRWLDAFSSAGHANVYAALTTIVGLGSLSVSEFRAFHEFGVIAALGIIAVLGAYIVILPPLSEVLGVTSTHVAKACREGALRGGRWGAPALAAVVAVSALGLPRVAFDRNLEALSIRDVPSAKLDVLVNETLGQSQTPAVILADNLTDVHTIEAEIERRRREEPDGAVLGPVVYREKLLPADQAEKFAILRDLHDEFQRLRRAPADPRAKELVAELTDLVNAGPLTANTLPREVAAPLSRNRAGEVMLVMPAGDLQDYETSEAFVRLLQRLPKAGGTVNGVSEAHLLHDVLTLAERDAPRMVVGVLVAIFIIASLGLGIRCAAILTTLNLFGLISMLGLLGLFGITLNFINVIVLPIGLGLAVDASFHREITAERYGPDLGRHRHTRRSIAAAFTTTMIGFAVLEVARHTGLRSVATVAVVALGASLAVQLLAYRIYLERT